jgi:O-antigen/teichoic acid export membrane protein
LPPKVRELGKQLAIYGAGDVAISAVNLLLLPIYVAYLSQRDYGVLGLLGAVEVIAKILFRLGLDGSFMRLFYESDDERGRQRLASTIFFFLLVTNGVLLAVSLGAAPWLARTVFNDAEAALPLRLVLLNTFAIGFTFFPFHVLRMEGRSAEFSLLAILRSVATVVLRLALVAGAGLGLLGVVIADVAVTAALMAVLLRRFASLIRPMFSKDVLNESLAFGLPRVPHAAAQQLMAVGDKFILATFRPIAEVGMYSMGVSFGLTQKLFLSAFEYAWAPFYYAAARERGAPALFATVTTYAIAALALLTAGLSAIARDLLDLMTRGVFVDAAPVVAWTAVGVFLQGVYLLTSIGLNITKRTSYYPASTIAAAAANIGLNYLLIPGYGMMGAAWANAAGYAVQAGLAFTFAQRVYPVRYEYGRLVRVLGASVLAFAAAAAVPDLPALAGVVVRGLIVVGIFTAVLWISGFFKREELRLLRRLRPDRGPRAPLETTELAGEIVAADLPVPELIADNGPPRAGSDLDVRKSSDALEESDLTPEARGR